MNGLELSRLYHEEHCAPLLRERFPVLAGRVAAGLAGEGSECFGFDDELSRDHDWGAAICLWLAEKDFETHGAELQSALNSLAKGISHMPIREESPMAAGRSGAMKIGAFYFRHLGFDEGPRTLAEWLRTSDDRLAAATNGMVFMDPLGEFTKIRNRLLEFYPEDVRRKKLAARLAMMAQTGQYNLDRCFKRGELVAARLAESMFISEGISAAFLLNRRYAPFYKWAHRALRGLPRLGAGLADLLDGLVAAGHGRKLELVEEISRRIAEELRRQGLSDSMDDFLLSQAMAVQGGIRDDALRAAHVFAG